MELSALLQLVSKYEKLAFQKLGRAGLFIGLNRLSTLLGKTITEEQFNSWQEKNISIFPNVQPDGWILQDVAGYPALYNHTGVDSYNKEGVFFILTPNPNFLEDTQSRLVNFYWENSETKFIPGSNEIPNLYLFAARGEHQNLDSLSLPREIAEDYFMVEALERMYDAKTEFIIKFVTENKERINKLRSSFEHTPKKLGGGADGVAFAISPTTVLKIFKNSFAFQKAKEAMERIHNNQLAKTEAMIYDVGLIGYLNDKPAKPVYYYLMERMIPVTKLGYPNEDIISDIVLEIKSKIMDSPLYTYLLDNALYIKNNVTAKRKIFLLTKKIEKEILFKVPKLVKHINETLSLQEDWLRALIEELIMKLITSRTDLHMGNIGVNSQGYLRYFDPSYDA
jgi:hypothetical protein